LSSTMGAGEGIDASSSSRFIRASALLCIASSRLAAGRSQLIVRLAVASHPYRGGCSRPELVKRRMHGWSSNFGAAVESGAARACGSMAAAVEAPSCVARADWTRQMQVRATAWPIGGSITPGRRDAIAVSRAAKLRRRDQGCTTRAPAIVYLSTTVLLHTPVVLLAWTWQMVMMNVQHRSLGAHNCDIQQSNTCRHITISSNHTSPALADPCPSCLYRSCTCSPTCIRRFLRQIDLSLHPCAGFRIQFLLFITFPRVLFLASLFLNQRANTFLQQACPPSPQSHLRLLL
jgi:hypothetical protein